MQQNFLTQLAHFFYALGVSLRLVLYRANLFKTYQLNAPVISVGNITFGGTGKTPCAAYIANYLCSEGLKVAILSRGYKRESKGRVEVSNGNEILCHPNISGDEPYLLAQQCPGVRVVVQADRYAAGKWLESQTKIDVFVLDDGYQHIRLKRDLNLLLLDATTDLDLVLNFREPLEAMDRADAVIITRASQLAAREDFRRNIEKYCQPNVPIFFADHRITGFRSITEIGRNIPGSSLNFFPVAALSGLGNPQRFALDLKNLGLNIVQHFVFGDHHRYTQNDLENIFRQAKAVGAEAIITTEKDAANIDLNFIQECKLPVYTAQLAFDCTEDQELKRLLLQTIRSAGWQPAS